MCQLNSTEINNIKQPDWIAPEILDAIKTRDIHRPLGNTVDYTFWRNKVISYIKRAKRDQYQSSIENNKGKHGSIYKIFQEVGAGKGLRKQSTIGSIKSEDSHTEDPKEIANAFNEFFL